jgi:hypothetical protein
LRGRGTTHINGAATQGENIADIGGINLAWDAFNRTNEYKSGTKIGGLTPAQRFFVGWSLGWMNQLRPENLTVRVKTDVHSPSPFRSIGPVTRMVPFYEAFGVKPGDKMYRAGFAACEDLVRGKRAPLTVRRGVGYLLRRELVAIRGLLVFSSQNDWSGASFLGKKTKL